MPKKITRELKNQIVIDKFPKLHTLSGRWNVTQSEWKPNSTHTNRTLHTRAAQKWNFHPCILLKWTAAHLLSPAMHLQRQPGKKKYINELIRLSIDFTAFVIHAFMLALYLHCRMRFILSWQKRKDLLFRRRKRKYSEMMSSLFPFSLFSVHSHAADFFCLLLKWSKFVMRC